MKITLSVDTALVQYFIDHFRKQTNESGTFPMMQDLMQQHDAQVQAIARAQLQAEFQAEKDAQEQAAKDAKAQEAAKEAAAVQVEPEKAQEAAATEVVTP